MLFCSTLVVFLVLYSNKSTWWQPRDLVNEMTATETGQFRLPPQLDVNSGNVFENFKRWKRQVEVYLAASGASEKDGKVQTAIILNCAGPHVFEVYDTLIWTDDGDKDKPDKVLDALERYCNPRDNEVIESYRLPGTVGQISHGAKNESMRVQFSGKRSDVERQNSFYCDWKTSRITPQGRQFDTRQSSKNL